MTTAKPAEAIHDQLLRLATVANPVVDGDESAWVVARTRQVVGILHPDDPVTAVVTAGPGLYDRLELVTGANHWTLDGIKYRLFPDALPDSTAPGRYFTVTVITAGVLYGPFGGIAYPGRVPSSYHETRWILEAVDGVPAAQAEAMARLLR